MPNKCVAGIILRRTNKHVGRNKRIGRKFFGNNSKDKGKKNSQYEFILCKGRSIKES